MVNEENFEILCQEELDELCEKVSTLFMLYSIEEMGEANAYEEMKKSSKYDFSMIARYLEKSDVNDLAERLQSETATYEEVSKLANEIIRCYYHHIQDLEFNY